MAEGPTKFDFWYAVNNTRIISLPARHLETFGTTMLSYHLISELMDTVSKVRVREGRIQAYRPRIVTPTSFTEKVLEGFGEEEAQKYIDWLKENKMEIYALEYWFKIKKEELSEHIISDTVEAVTERVSAEVKNRQDPFSAVVIGVDNPWEVCLLKLIIQVFLNSRAGNLKDLMSRNLIGTTDGISNAVLEDVEQTFKAAALDRSKIGYLAKKLEYYGLFKNYEDRFFSLVRGK